MKRAQAGLETFESETIAPRGIFGGQPPSGAKARSFLPALCGTTEEAAENGRIAADFQGEAQQGLKPALRFKGFYGPTEVVPLLQDLPVSSFSAARNARARQRSRAFKLRNLSTGLLAAALILCAHGAAGQAATETVEVEFSNPAVAPSHWTLTLHPDGSGHFSSYGGGMAGGNSDLKSPPVNREIHLSGEFTHRVFETAYRHKLFNEKCDSHLKVAFQGQKTLRYEGPKGSGSCSFNYSKDRELQDLSDSIMAVEQTIMEGARLEVLLKHDPLGLDEEMNFLVQAAKDGRVQQICAIKGILVELANDPGVLDAVRKRADLLLQDAKI